MLWKSLFLIVTLVFCVVYAAPQGPNTEVEKPEPYAYEYKVEDAEKNLFFDKNEIGDEQGKVTGRYSVWLPDGRLMTVDYTVDKDSGFVPKITFQDNAQPIG